MPVGGQQKGGTVLAKHVKLYSFSEKSICYVMSLNIVNSIQVKLLGALLF